MARDHSKPPKANWGEESVVTYRDEALRAAKDLGYDKRCIQEIRMAETKDAIANAVSRGRHRQDALEEEIEKKRQLAALHSARILGEIDEKAFRKGKYDDGRKR